MKVYDLPYMHLCVQQYSEDVLKEWKLLRASERFRVISLGLPVPPYHGNSLDPPLRSRFQARHIPILAYTETHREIKDRFPNLSVEK